MWKTSVGLLEVSKNLILSINHANYGEIFEMDYADVLPENRIYFCLDNVGQISWMTGGGEKASMDLKAGHLYFIPGNIKLNYSFKPGRLVAIHFHLEILKGYDIFFYETECLELRDVDGVSERVLKELQETVNLGTMISIQAQILKTASRFCKLTFSELEEQTVLREKYRTLLDIIDEELDAKLTIAYLAKRLKIHRDQLSKSFKRDFKITLKRYLTNMLISKASHLLLSKGMRVNETADALNYSNEFYFSRFFKANTGMSPSKYIQQYNSKS